MSTKSRDKIVADLEQRVRPWVNHRDAGHASGRMLRPLGQTAGHQAGITRVVVCVPRRLVSRDPCALQAKIAALSGPRVAIHHGLHRLLPGPPFQR